MPTPVIDPGSGGDRSSREVFEALAERRLPEWARVAETAREVALAPGEALFLSGAAFPYACVVREGLLKLEYDGADGRAWVKAFCPPGLLFASLTALEPDGTTSFAARAVAATQVTCFEARAIERQADLHPEWQRLLTRAYRRYGLRKEKRERSLLVDSAEARYLAFVREHPELERQLSQRDIAAYVRVTPEALSRIRRRLRGDGPQARGGKASQDTA